MKCPKCRYETPEGSKFCNECGSRIEAACSTCGNTNPPASKFCSECGSQLNPSPESKPQLFSFDEKLEKIQRYLPKGLTEKILSQRDKIEGERKQVTVMFCDMAGFTELSEKIGPEEAYTVMDQVYEILIHKVHEYEGTVNEMTGDGVLALFGAPIAIEDAPQRAIRVAMAIHREMSKLNDSLKKNQQGLPILKVRVGIHSGPVVVGTLGNDLRVEFKAVGDTVNLASRLESLADPGATYVTEDTFKLTEGLFRFEALGQKIIKGKKNPVIVYRVISTSSRRTRFDVSAERGLTPFIGRERELELLLDGFERSKHGRGQSFSIMAEAGVGKSRLLFEFRKAISSEDILFLEGKCLSYSRGIAYHPVIDILKSTFSILDNDECSQVRKKVEAGLKTLGISEATALPCLLELLSVKESGINRIPMSSEARKERIMSAVRQVTLKGAEIHPLVIAIEDLHWIDRSSEEFLKSQLETISGARIFLIFTYRPEYVHIWGGKSYHSQINLNRLSNRESLAMVSHLLNMEKVDTRIEELVLEKAEGVPFFIEEFVKSLKDLKIIEKNKKTYFLAKDVKSISIPSTIQEVIMARVDSLTEGARELLQIGSVIEREFSYELIKKVSSLEEKDLLSRLSALKDSELVYERGIYPQSTYIFKNALTREVVYESILSSKKKRLHQQIGNAIEELFKNKIDEQYEILAKHYIQSEDYLKGAEYSRLTAKKALNTASINDAIAAGKKRVACLEKLTQTEDIQKQIIDARTVLGLYLSQINLNIEARETVSPIIDLAIEHDYKKRLCQIYTILGSHSCWIEEDLPNAFDQLEKALNISKEINEYVALAYSNDELGLAFSLNCDFEKALVCFKNALDLTTKSDSRWGTSQVKSLIAFFVYNSQGKIDLSYKTSTEAVGIAEEIGDIYSQAVAMCCHGATSYYKGFLDEAKNYLSKSVNFCERINLFAYESVVHHFLGEIFFDAGDYHKSIEHFEKAVWLYEQNRHIPAWMHLNKIAAARAKLMTSDPDTDFKSLFEYSRKNRINMYDGWMKRLIGEALLNFGNQRTSESEDWINQAIEADKKNNMKFHLGKDYALYAEFFKRQKDMPNVRNRLSDAITIFNDCGAEGWTEKYTRELVTLN